MTSPHISQVVSVVPVVIKNKDKVVCDFSTDIICGSKDSQKPSPPLALDASLLRALDGAAVWKSLSKLRYFRPAAPSPYGASTARR